MCIGKHRVRLASRAVLVLGSMDTSYLSALAVMKRAKSCSSNGDRRSVVDRPHISRLLA